MTKQTIIIQTMNQRFFHSGSQECVNKTEDLNVAIHGTIVEKYQRSIVHIGRIHLEGLHVNFAQDRMCS